MRVRGVSGKVLSTTFAVLGATLTLVMSDTAEARRYHRHHSRHAAGAISPVNSPIYAAMVVDANTGKVLHAVNENELRHPASITKVMTLFLLFEQLERGKISLETMIPVSAHAASMAPTKLGLRAGSQIAVEHAIKAIVTKSANDMAVAVAEALGGTEERFAEMMTAKAHALGMSRTHYENASGLPDPDQVTTAHDLTVLGRAIQERFPRYYAFFSTHQFVFNGQVMRNHNHLLERIEGMDGIKTGYTHASGFNLLTSVKRGGHRIVAVVLGGPSAGTRDRIMAGLIEENIDRGGTTRVAWPIGENGSGDDVEPARVEPSKPEPTRIELADRRDPPRVDAPRPAAFAPNPQPTPLPVIERPRPAVVASVTRPPADDRTATIPPTRQTAQDGSTRPVAGGASTGSGGPVLRWSAGPKPVAAPVAAKPAHNETRLAKLEPPKDPHASHVETGRPAAARSGVMIQIGAAEEPGKANELLSRARSGNPALAGATPFTEKVQKGSGALWRARFAGLSESQAENACKSLKKNGIPCFTTRN